MELCRACLTAGTNMIPMDEPALENFNQITSLKVKLQANISLYTCEECHQALSFCKEFRNKCIASDNALNAILFPTNPELDLNQDEYYLLVKKESQEDVKEGEMSDDYYDSEIENVETFKPTIEMIVEQPASDEIEDIPELVPDILCGLCSAKFTDKDMLLDHLATHIGDNKCQICLELSYSKSQLFAHRMQHVPDDQKGCIICDRAFGSTSSLQFHYMTVHKLEKAVFDELRQEYFINTVEFIYETTSEKTDVSKVKRRDLKNKFIEQKGEIEKKHSKRREIVVDTAKIVLSETELKELLGKHKEGFVPYYCGICPQELEDKRQLTKHLQYHKMDTHCSLCEQEFKSYPHLLAHRLAHVPDNQSSCLFCHIMILNETALKEHYLNKHKLTEDVLPYFCKQCSRSYETEMQIKQHIRLHHGEIKYICDYCSKGFSRKSSLKSHMISHQDHRSYKCHKCDYRAKYPGGLKDHILRRHTSGRVYCGICRRAYPSMEHLDRHRPCARAMEADVMCPICGINLKMSSSLNRHLRTHTGGYRYTCELCPSQFKSKSCFDAHVDKHKGIRKYECEYCPMKFYSQPVLIKHRRVHTGERPYACKLCDKAFTGNHNLKVHMKVHGLELINRKK